MSDDTSLLTVSGLEKSFGPVRVLSDVAFSLGRGEVHALVGENGAGKSTLCRIIAGLTRPGAGVMTCGGCAYAPRDRRDAARHGVRMVMQELNLIGNMTVAESIFFERLPHRLGWIDYKRLHRAARAALDRVGLADVDPACPVRRLGIGRQQLVEIAAGLSQRCDVLILDEPTAALTEPEIARLFARICELKAAGTGIVYISHRLEEIQRIADRISILRDGRMVASGAAGAFSMDEIVRLMVGRDVAAAAPAAVGVSAPGPVALRVVGLRREPHVRDVSFEVRGGEILGFAGLMGAGRTETMRAVFGADRPEAGAVYVGGDQAPAAIRSPRDAVRRGIALLTENRKEQGLLLALPVADNITLPSLARLSTAAGRLRQELLRRESVRWIEALRVRCRGPDQPVRELSGGNQQKVVMARWLLRDCDVLIFDEPTRGIDVGARFEVYDMLRGLAARGKALVVVSSDLPELMALCDRIAVMSAGRIAAVFSRGGWTQDGIMAAALSGYMGGNKG